MVADDQSSRGPGLSNLIFPGTPRRGSTGAWESPPSPDEHHLTSIRKSWGRNGSRHTPSRQPLLSDAHNTLISSSASFCVRCCYRATSAATTRAVEFDFGGSWGTRCEPCTVPAEACQEFWNTERGTPSTLAAQVLPSAVCDSALCSRQK